MVKKLKWNLILMSLLYVGLGIFLVMKVCDQDDAQHHAPGWGGSLSSKGEALAKR